MGFKCGIVGLPNVGKSTIFNALTKTQSAQAANYPFCTIEPNVGKVGVPDPRLDALTKIVNPQRVVATQLDFVDIAGLVRGASKGEGLGNQFLGHIREVDAICHVLRCFDNEDITHVDGHCDPLRDVETVETELMLADLESLEKRMTGLSKKAKSGETDAKLNLAIMEKLRDGLAEGKFARTLMDEFDGNDLALAEQMQLLTSCRVVYLCNIDEGSLPDGNHYTATVAEWAKARGSAHLIISAAVEAEISLLEEEEERQMFLNDLGLSASGLDRMINEGYAMLDLITFFTAGEKEVRSWTTYRGAKAPQAAGVIHTDFERGFIAAETIAYDDFVEYNGEQGAKEAGKARLEGRDYLMQDGDVCHFRFNV